MERQLGNLSKQLSTAADDITHKARQSQQLLEDHFTDLREQVFTSLERREAELLSQLDQQVELKQGILQEHREEVAMAVAKVMACQEEGKDHIMYRLGVCVVCVCVYVVCVVCLCSVCVCVV